MIRVLLVDDSPLVLHILQRMLSRFPEIQVVGTATNGREALDLLPELNPDVICTDLHMPVMDGLEFTRAVMDEYPKGQTMTVVETRVGRKGTPNQVEFTGTEVTDSTNDEALDDGVPIADIELAAAQGLPDPLGRAVEGLTELVALKREVRAASLVFTAGNYAASNKTTLAGNSQWSDYADGHSDPIDDIVTGLDSCIMRPNIAVMGHAVSSKLRRHPAILKAFNGTTGDTGMVPLQYLKDLFELEDIYVGQGWVNTAKKGQAVSLSRVWGNSCALLY